jgi:putative ABC transport system permease protein
MKFMITKDLLKLSTRMFVARRGRTFLTVLGIGIGFGVILFLVSLGYGLQNSLLGTIASSGMLTTLDVTPNSQEGKILDQGAVGEFGKIDGVDAIEPGYDFSARMKLGDIISDGRAVVASSGFLELEGLKIMAGKTFDKNNPKGILVSSAFGKIFGKNPEELVGQKVSFSLIDMSQNSGDGKNIPQKNIEGQDFEIIGVTGSDETVFWANNEALQIPPEVAYANLKVKCRSSEAMSSVKDAISQKGFSVSSVSETISEVNKLFQILNIVLGLFGIITLAVSSIGMFNTMSVALLERTREIGIMRSIGASKTDILSMFVIESTLMGFCGGVVGIVLGVASGQIVTLIANIAARYFGGKIPHLFDYPLWFLGSILAFSIVVGFATGIGPAKRASSLDPYEALRSR